MEDSRRGPKKVQEGPRFSLVRFIIYWNPNVIATGPFGAPTKNGTRGCQDQSSDPMVKNYDIQYNDKTPCSDRCVPSPAGASRPRETARRG